MRASPAPLLATDAKQDTAPLLPQTRGGQVRPGDRVWSKNSCGCSMVELQESAEPLATPHGASLAHLLARKEEQVALALMIALAVEVADIREQRGS